MTYIWSLANAEIVCDAMRIMRDRRKNAVLVDSARCMQFDFVTDILGKRQTLITKRAAKCNDNATQTSFVFVPRTTWTH